MADYYVDQVLGSWTLKKQNKQFLLYERRAEVTLPKDSAVTTYENEEPHKVYGKVTLWEHKRIDVPTSVISFFRGVDKQEKTITEKTIL